MRPIGKLQDETQARRFGDFLYGKGIDNQVDPTSQGTWEVWILDDANVEASTSLLERFSRDPRDSVFVQEPGVAARRRQPDEAVQAPRRNRVVDARTIFYMPSVPIGPLSMVLIAISIAATLFTTLGENESLRQILSISQFRGIDGRYIEPHGLLPEVFRGQVWRLFTPMFLHFNPLHILFNVLWLRDLGSMIEARKTSKFLLLLTLILAGASNVGQYLYNGPSFGGMSGVVYGLLGYLWMQGKFNPASKLSLQPQTVTFMIVWFFVCLSGLAGPIANTAHAVGLGVGIAWGFWDARLRVALRRY
jgi:GlpG protein